MPKQKDFRYYGVEVEVEVDEDGDLTPAGLEKVADVEHALNAISTEITRIRWVGFSRFAQSIARVFER